MQFNKQILKTVAATALLLTTLNATDVEGVVELKYGIADGKATSYLDSASDITQAPHLSLGAQLKEYNARALVNYKPIKWKDADAHLLSLSLDYIYELESNLELFAGAGIGTLSYKAKDMSRQELAYTA